MVGRAKYSKTINGEGQTQEADTIDGFDNTAFLHRDGTYSMNAFLDMGGYDIRNIGDLLLNAGENINLGSGYLDGGGSVLGLATDGSGNGYVNVYDAFNNQSVFQAHEGGLVVVAAGKLQAKGGVVEIPNGGVDNAGAIKFANITIRENQNGEAEVVDSAGNVTVFS